MKNLIMVAGLLLCTSAVAQSQSRTTTTDRQAVASATTAQVELLTTELGLSERQAAKAQELVMRAETEVAPLRAQHERIQSQLDVSYEPYYKELSTALTPEQNEKLALLRRSGKLSAGCGISSAGCGDHGKAEAKGSGCCAGGKAGSSAAPATKEKSTVTQTRSR